jgi:hypothetical protein
MQLCFSIDALSAAADQAWRLQDDGSWRECTYAEPLQPGDACVENKATAEDWAGRRLKRDKAQGLIAKGKAGMFDFLMRGIFAHVVLHRLSAAPVPDRAQMCDTLASLTPGNSWLLYLDVAGHFRALDTRKQRIIGNSDIAVRGEIASSEDYVGPKAIEDESLMDEMYRQFLGGWLEHLTTSNLGIFVPDAEKLKPEEHYLEQIHAWQPEN